MKKLLIPAAIFLVAGVSAFTTNSAKSTLSDEPYRIDIPGVECSPVTENCTRIPTDNTCTHTLSGAALFAMNDNGTACDVALYKP